MPLIYQSFMIMFQYIFFQKKKREILTSAQRQLEQKQREEEDRLYEKFMSQRDSNAQMIQKEVDEEWEVKLKELTKFFDKDFKKKAKKNGKEGGQVSSLS